MLYTTLANRPGAGFLTSKGWSGREGFAVSLRLWYGPSRSGFSGCPSQYVSVLCIWFCLWLQSPALLGTLNPFFLTGTASKYLLTPGMCKTLGCYKISSMGTFEPAILCLGGPAGSCDLSLLGYFPTPSVLTSCFLLKMQTLWLKNDFKKHFLASMHLLKR